MMLSKPQILFSVFLLLLLVNISSECNCGREGMTPFIIRGEIATPGQFPWIVYVRWMRKDEHSFHYCTGSIISPNYVLTAAHCVPKDEDPLPVSVFTWQGCGVMRNVFGGPEYKAEQIKRHAGYDKEGVEGGNDIALIKLKEPIEKSMPVCLPAENRSFENLVAAGWGEVDDEFGTKVSDCLRQADLKTVTDTMCRLIFPTANHEKVMCAGGNTGICQGDSGGALMSRNSTDGRVYQAGINSFVASGCNVMLPLPSAFERIIPHIQWIRENSEGACFK